MSLDSIVRVTVTAETQVPTQAGFGTPLIAAYHTRYLDRAREYADLDEITDDGFLVTDAAYLAAQKVFSQQPRARTLKIGRSALACTQTIRLTPTSVVAGVVYTGKISGIVDETFSITVAPASLMSAVCTAIEVAINALGGAFTATASATYVDVVANTPGALFGFSDLNRELEIDDRTADPGIATDLTAIEAADPDWYGLSLDSNSRAEAVAAAAWLETRHKIGSFDTADSGASQAVVTSDVASLFVTNGYARSHVMVKQQVRGYAGAALLGDRLPDDPGSDTWSFKTLNGIPVDRWTTAQQSAITAKNATFYSTFAGVAITKGGRSGAGEWMDTVRGMDWYVARQQEALAGVLFNARKVPYTDQGVDMLRSAAHAVNGEAVRRGFLRADPAPTVTAPLVADVSPTDRANRLLPDLETGGEVAGAIHEIDMRVTLSA